MTRALMPGRAHLASVPACTLAESLTDDECALLAELGLRGAAPGLYLVPSRPALAAEPTPAADLRRARRRQQIADWTVRVAALAVAAWVVINLLGKLRELAL